jgi:hypothetical protein
MSPLSNAERERRWRERLKVRAGRNFQISDRNLDTMTAAEVKAEYDTLRDILRTNLVRLVPLTVRLRELSYYREDEEPGTELLDQPESDLEDLIAAIDRNIASSPPEKPKRRQNVKKQPR